MSWWQNVAASRRAPDFVIGSTDNPYLRRWWIIPRNRFFNIYLHHFLRSDDERALHDHPWINCSYLLEGEYTEWSIARGGVHHKRLAKVGSLKFRRPTTAHRVELHAGPCWSLFITGPVVREWGFHCSAGWRSWKIFTSERDRGEIGRGCE